MRDYQNASKSLIHMKILKKHVQMKQEIYLQSR